VLLSVVLICCTYICADQDFCNVFT